MHAMACPLLSIALLERLDTSWNQTVSHDIDAQMTICAVERSDFIRGDVKVLLVEFVEIPYGVGVISPSNC